MEIFFLDPTEKTPLIILDREREKFEIIGVSVPENGTEFYKPVLNWISRYAKDPLPLTEFVINLEYFNIISSKMLLFIFYKLMEIRDKGMGVKVQWHYSDDYLFEAGTDYEYITRLDFNFTEISKEKISGVID